MTRHRRLFLALILPCVAGCTVLTAIDESFRDNSPQGNLKRNTAETNRIKELADGGDRYAKIELAKKCFEPEYPCLVADPAQIFKTYSDQGIEIATYYYASYRLGLDPRGYASERCADKACIDRDAAEQLFRRLAQKGCAYETRAFERSEMIHPCARAGRAH